MILFSGSPLEGISDADTIIPDDSLSDLEIDFEGSISATYPGVLPKFLWVECCGMLFRLSSIERGDDKTTIKGVNPLNSFQDDPFKTGINDTSTGLLLRTMSYLFPNNDELYKAAGTPSAELADSVSDYFVGDVVPFTSDSADSFTIKDGWSKVSESSNIVYQKLLLKSHDGVKAAFRSHTTNELELVKSASSGVLLVPFDKSTLAEDSGIELTYSRLRFTLGSVSADNIAKYFPQLVQVDDKDKPVEGTVWWALKSYFNDNVPLPKVAQIPGSGECTYAESEGVVVNYILNLLLGSSVGIKIADGFYYAGASGYLNSNGYKGDSTGYGIIDNNLGTSVNGDSIYDLGSVDFGSKESVLTALKSKLQSFYTGYSLNTTLPIVGQVDYGTVFASIYVVDMSTRMVYLATSGSCDVLNKVYKNLKFSYLGILDND